MGMFLFLVVFPVHGGLVPCGSSIDDPTTPEDETVPCQFCHFFVMFDRIVRFVLFTIVPPVATLMIAIGGFMFIFAYAGHGGGTEMLSRAKVLLKAVAIGLLIIYGAWVLVNTFFMAIGVTIWEGGGKWWKINCESSAPVSSGPAVPAGGGVSGLSPSRPIIITERNVLGSGFNAQVDFLNTSNETRQYAVFLYDAKGEMVTQSPHTEEWSSIGPGQTRTFNLSPNVYGSNLEKLQQAGSNYTIAIKWRPTTQSPQGGSMEYTRDLPRTLEGLPN